MRKYCPNCQHFRNMDSHEHPPNGRLTVDMLEDADGCAIYGCYNPIAWREYMPMRVIDIQLLRAVECGSFVERRNEINMESVG